MFSTSRVAGAIGAVAAILALSVPAAEAKRCDKNYRGACLSPYAYDYDCAGGSGDGPKYVYGAVRVVGVDHYDLDSDNDGWGCE